MKASRVQDDEDSIWPDFDEMLDPGLLDKDVRDRALTALKQDELNPINLFNITWKDAAHHVRKVVLPKALTGIDANIVVMLGYGFPSGSHKVGPAYSTLIEGIVDGDILPASTPSSALRRETSALERPMFRSCSASAPSSSCRTA